MPKKKESPELELRKKQLEVQVQNGQLLQSVLDKGFPLLEKYLSAKLEKVEGPRIRWSIVGFVGVLVLVVLISGFLVYESKMDASNFTFLLGTLIGAVITLLGDVLLPPAQ